MARTFIYERGVQCIVPDNSLYEKLNSLENGVKIKEEPPDQDGKYSNTETSLAEDGTLINAYNETTEAKQTSTSPLNNKENVCVAESVSGRRKRKKYDPYTKRKRRKHRRSENTHKPFLAEEEKHSGGIEKESKGLIKNQTCQAKGKQESVHKKGRIIRNYYSQSDSLECNICLLPMQNATILKKHQLRHSDTPTIICKTCNVFYTTKSSLQYHTRMCTGVVLPHFHHCDICGGYTKEKRILQAHIFHKHYDHIFPPDLVERSPETSKFLDNVATPKRVSKSPKVKQRSPKIVLNTPKHRSKTPNGQLDKSLSGPESLNNSQNDVAQGRNKEEVLITPVKKMRQTMLTEFLSVSSKKEEKLTPKKNETGERNGIESSGTNRSSPDKCEKPFVQIHTDAALMIELLNKSEHVKNEPLDEEVRSITSRQSTPYSLRPTIPPIYTPDTFMFLNSSLKRKRRHSGVDLSQTEQKSSPRKRKNTEMNENDLKVKFNIKECYVRLVRYDTVSQIPQSLPEETKASETPTHSGVLECPQEKNPDHHSEENSPNEQRKPFQCKICNKMFSSKRILNEHKELFHVAYISSICNARYTSKYKLLHHYLRQHTIFKRTDCCVCRQSFESRSHLQRHLLLHCIQVLRTKHDRFPVDVIMRCNAFQKNHVCDNCGKRFWLSSCLKNHENACTARPLARAKKATSRKNALGSKESHDTDKSFASQISSATNSTTMPQSRISETEEIDTPTTSKSPSLQTQRQFRCDRRRETRNSTRERRLRKRTTISYEISDGSSESEADDLISTSSTEKDTTDEIHECSVCNMKFGSLIKLNYHTRLVGGELIHRCTLCTIALPNKRLLDQHVNMTHMLNSQGKYKNTCKFCNQVFVNAENQLIHEKHFHASQIAVVPEQAWLNEEQVWNINTSCSTCNVVFENYDKLVEHNMYYYEGQSFTCTFCGQSFLGLFMLHHHSKLLHYPENTRKSYTFTCDICNEGFNQESHFHAHKLHVHVNVPSKSSQSNTPSDTQQLQSAPPSSLQFPNAPTIEARQFAFAIYICNICQMSFTNEADLTSHEIQYSLNGDYLCNGCDKRCRTFMLLKQHYSLNHIGTDVANGYKCKQCAEVYTTTTSLTCHERHVHPEESAERYALIAALEKNVDRAMDLRKSEPPTLKCLICHTTFQTESDLREHLFEYANIGDHSCAVCHRRFAEVKRLEEHKLKHSRISTIVAEHYCPICQEGQTSASNVSIHLLHLHGSETFERVLAKRGCLPTKLVSDNHVDNTTKNSVSHPTPLPPPNFEGVAELVSNAPPEQQPNALAQDTSNPSSNIPALTGEKAQSVEEETPVIPITATDDTLNASPLITHATATNANSDSGADFSSNNPTPSSVDGTNSNTKAASSKMPKKVLMVVPRTLTVATLLKDMEGAADADAPGEKDYQCAECGIKFNTRKNVAKHLLKYINEGDFLCDRCPRRFIHELLCEEHCRRHQTVNETTHRYTCRFCTDRFKTLRAGRSHLIHLHKKKKKNLHKNQGATDLIRRMSNTKEPQTKDRAPQQKSSSESGTSTRVPETNSLPSEVTNPNKETETDPAPVIATKAAPTISTRSLACCMDFSCESCSLPFDNFLAYHAHCRLVHPNLILFADYISNGSNCVPTSNPSNVVMPVNNPTNSIIVDASNASQSPAVPLEIPSEELEIIWEKKLEPKTGTPNVNEKGDSVRSTPVEVTAETRTPRLKVRPFAKIIETLTIDGDSDHSSDIIPELPEMAQMNATVTDPSGPMRNMNNTATSASVIPQFQ